MAYWKCKTKGCRGENVKEAIINKAFVIAWNSIVEHVDEHSDWWKELKRSDNPLIRVSPIDTAITNNAKCQGRIISVPTLTKLLIIALTIKQIP